MRDLRMFILWYKSFALDNRRFMAYDNISGEGTVRARRVRRVCAVLTRAAGIVRFAKTAKRV